MGKILVGRDNPKEVNVGITVSSVAKAGTENAETKEELVEAPVEDEQVAAAEEGDDAPVKTEEKETAPKRRGKKRGKA